MDTVLDIVVLVTVGTIIAALINEFAKNDPNAKGGIFQRANAVWSWSIKNAFGGS